jgi:hypothetical protein
MNNYQQPLTKPAVDSEPRPITPEELLSFQQPDNLHLKQFVDADGAGMYEVIGYSRARDKTIKFEVLFDDCEDPGGCYTPPRFLVGSHRNFWNLLESSGFRWSLLAGSATQISFRSQFFQTGMDRTVSDQNGWHSFPVNASGMNRNHANIL